MRPRDAFDIELWGLRLRLHPLGNGCEKNALFTPQMYDVMERDVLAQAIERKLAAGASFTFVDVGANVGLYSLFVAARAGRARASSRSSRSPASSTACASISRPIRT